MSKLGPVYKQPAEFESYSVTYEDDLATGDTVVSATAAVSPAGLTISSVTTVSPRVRFWAAGGTDGASYKVTLTTTTATGRILEDEVMVRVKEL